MSIEEICGVAVVVLPAVGLLAVGLTALAVTLRIFDERKRR